MLLIATKPLVIDLVVRTIGANGIKRLIEAGTELVITFSHSFQHEERLVLHEG